MNKALQRFIEDNPDLVGQPPARVAAVMYQRYHEPAGDSLQDFVRKLEARGGPLFDSTPIPEPGRGARIGRGVVDITDGITQLAKRTFGSDSDVKEFEDRANYEANLYERGAGEGFDGYRVIGNMGALAPAALIPGGQTKLAQAAIGGAIGAASAGAAYTPTDGGNFATQKTLQTVPGAIGGAAAPVAIQAVAGGIGKAAQGLSRAGQAVWGRLAPEGRASLMQRIVDGLAKNGVEWERIGEVVQGSLMDDALRAIQATGKLDTGALARKARIESQGFSPTTGQVTRDPMTFAGERNLAKIEEVGASLQDRFTEQNSQLMSMAEDIEKQIAGPQAGMTEFGVGEMVEGVAKGRARDTQTIVGEAYDAAANTPGYGDVVPDEALKEGLTEVYSTFEDALPDVVSKRIRALVDGDKTPTVEHVNEALRLVNKRLRNASDAERMHALGDTARVLYRALDDFAANGDSPAAEAIRKASRLAAVRFGLIKGPRGQERRVVEKLLDNNDNLSRWVRNRVIGGDARELDHLRRFLVVGTDEFPPTDATKNAWQAIRGQVVQQANGKARVGDPATDEFNAKAFRKFWDDLGADRRAMLFSPEENQVIDDFVTTGVDLISPPPGAPVNYSNTTPMLTNLVLRLSHIPLFGDMATLLFGAGRLGKQALEEAAQQVQARDALTGAAVTPAARKANAEQIEAWSRRYLGAGRVSPGGASATQETLTE